MTRIFIAILLITFPTLGNADDPCKDYADYTSCTSSGLEPNCYWEGNYNTEGSCGQCPPSHPYYATASSANSDLGINSCYKDCIEEFDNLVCEDGGKKANVTKVDTDKIYYHRSGEKCTYGYDENSCDTSYYHVSPDQNGCCDANIITKVTLTTGQHCMNNKGIKIWQDNDYLTFCTECVTDYHLENTNTAITTDGTNITYGTCKTNTPPCSAVIETNDTITCTITGNAQWNTDNGKYNYSACTCRALTPDELGNCGTVYNTWNGTQWTDSEYKCTECKAGACWDGTPNNKCARAQQGYYSPANDTKCHECPAGSTTKDQGADSLTDCILTPGTTKFCSNNGDCFTLPNGAKTSPASKTP